MDYSSFMGMRLHRLHVRDCTAREVDWSECDLTRSDFRGSRLSGALFRHANLTRADLTDTTDCFVDVGTCTLHKTQIDLGTAAAVLVDLGLVVDALG
jgi:uncharacterized protein YjbI with pentapeptide repeats